MKSKYSSLAVILIIAGAILTGCNVNREKKVEDAKENVNQANQELKEAQAEYDREWQQFKTDAEFKIDANQKRIDELKLEIKTASKKFKAKYEKEIIADEQKNIELRKKIADYKYEGKDKWAEFKLEFNRDVEIVGKSLSDIFTKK